MPRITSLPGGQATTISSTDNVIVEPSGGQTKYAAFSVLVDGVITSLHGGCRLSEDAPQDIDASTITAITFSTEEYDVGGFHSTVSNTSRITIPAGKGGLYLVGCALSWDQDSSGLRVLWLRKNGTDYLEMDARNNVGASWRTVNRLTAMLELDAADYLEMCGWHDSTTDPLETWWGSQPGANTETYFWIQQITEA